MFSQQRFRRLVKPIRTGVKGMLLVLFVLSLSVRAWTSSCISHDDTECVTQTQSSAGPVGDGQGSVNWGALAEDFVLFGYIIGGEQRKISSGESSLVVDLGHEIWKRPCPRERYAFRVNASMYVGKAGVVSVVHEDSLAHPPKILWRDFFIVQDGGALQLDISIPVDASPAAKITASTLAVARTIKSMMTTALSNTGQPFSFCLARKDAARSICSIHSRPLVLVRIVAGNMSSDAAVTPETSAQPWEPSQSWMYQCHYGKCDVYNDPDLFLVPVENLCCTVEDNLSEFFCQLLYPRRLLLCMTAIFILTHLSVSHFHALALSMKEPLDLMHASHCQEGYGTYEPGLFQSEEDLLLSSMWNRDKNGRLIRQNPEGSASDQGKMVVYQPGQPGA